MRSHPGLVEPDVYFRIVHSAQVGHNNVSVATYREQTVEIALGPKGAFENGNIGALTRRVPAARIGTAAQPNSCTLKAPKEPRTPRVVELLRKAIEWRRQLDAGELHTQADIARREGITRARVSQVLGMLRLAPEIQKRVLALPVSVRRTSITERLLHPITGITNHRDQIREFYKLLKQAAVPLRPRSPEGSCRS